MGRPSVVCVSGPDKKKGVIRFSILEKLIQMLA
jgi:hypothetical protein